MTLAKCISSLPFIFLLAGCDLVSMQYPFGLPPGVQSSGLSQSVTQSQRQVTGSQRTQYIWDKALEGMAMGGSLAGPYGAGGGLILGLLAGLFTADAHYAQLNTQIQTEQAKDKELETKIEQEMQRQRELEAQLANSGGNPAARNGAEPLRPAQQLTPKTTRVALADAPIAVASLTKKENIADLPVSPFKNVEVRDINGDGVPDLWIYYSPLKPSEIVRQEEATHWDGRVDAWSYFKDGNLVRREVDTRGKGVADLVYYYDQEQIVREERDENGTGYVSFRAIYQNGRRPRQGRRGYQRRWQGRSLDLL
jgi:hypothetical protein